MKQFERASPCRRHIARRTADTAMEPIPTFDQLPKASDADGNGMVVAWNGHFWSSESWRYVAGNPLSCSHWISIKKLPRPEE